MTTTAPHPPRQPRRFTRSSTDKMLGGVAGGLGEYFSVDPRLVRIGFAIATLLNGAGALVYLALLVLTPSDADGDSAPRGPSPMPA